MEQTYHPRRKNFNIAGHAHELTFTCYHQHKFLASDRTRQWLAQSIQAACATHHFQLWAYVFMPEHVHLIVFPSDPVYDIAAFRRLIKEPMARQAIQFLENNSPHWIEKITRKRGQRTERLFWQSGGGYDRNIDDPKTLWTMMDYLHQNPVRRGLVKRAVDWQWSSANWYTQRIPGPIPLDPMTDAWAIAC